MGINAKERNNLIQPVTVEFQPTIAGTHEAAPYQQIYRGQLSIDDNPRARQSEVTQE